MTNNMMYSLRYSRIASYFHLFIAFIITLINLLTVKLWPDVFGIGLSISGTALIRGQRLFETLWY